MLGTLGIIGIVLCLGWAVWWWLLRDHAAGLAELQREAEELERRHAA